MFRNDQELGAEGHDLCTRPVSFLMCSKFKWNPLVELNTTLIGKELIMVSVKILIVFLKPEIKL